jgi:hypothetical protein
MLHVQNKMSQASLPIPIIFIGYIIHVIPIMSIGIT